MSNVGSNEMSFEKGRKAITLLKLDQEIEELLTEGRGKDCNGKDKGNYDGNDVEDDSNGTTMINNSSRGSTDYDDGNVHYNALLTKMTEMTTKNTIPKVTTITIMTTTLITTTTTTTVMMTTTTKVATTTTTTAMMAMMETITSTTATMTTTTA